MPVIIVSNLTPDEVYTKVKPIRHRAFTTRLLRIDYVEPFNNVIDFTTTLNHLNQ